MKNQKRKSEHIQHTINRGDMMGKDFKIEKGSEIIISGRVFVIEEMPTTKGMRAVKLRCKHQLLAIDVSKPKKSCKNK